MKHGALLVAAGIVLLAAATARAEPPTAKEVDELFDRMFRALSDHDPAVRRQAAAALVQAGAHAARLPRELGRCLHDRDGDVRLRAARTLRDLAGNSPDAVRDLVDGLQDRRKDVRFEAAYTLGLIGAPGAEVVSEVIPALVKAMQDPTSGIRPRAAWALGRMGIRAEGAIPALLQAIKDTSAADQEPHGITLADGAYSALCQMGPAARSAVPGLLAAMKERPGDTAIQAIGAGALVRVGAPDEVVIPLLTGLLRDRRHRAIHGGIALDLQKYGQKAKPAVPALLLALDVRDVRDNEQASDILVCGLPTLRAIGVDAKEAVPLLTAVVRDAKLNTTARSTAARVLREYGPAARAAIPALVAATKEPGDAREALREDTIAALRAIGPDAAPDLADLVKDMKRPWCDLAAGALRSMGPRAKAAIPALEKALTSEDPAVRMAAASALEKIRP